MVAWLWKQGVIEDLALLRALLRVPREAFIPAALGIDAYSLDAIPLPDGTSITCPLYVTRMITLLAVEPGDSVLEVGTGTGYQCALLASLGCKVSSVEVRESLHHQARKNLHRAGISGVDLYLGDGSAGVPDKAPFDAIVLGCAAESLPAALLEQLQIGGRAVAPIGPLDGIQTLKLFTKVGPDALEERSIRGAFFVPLISSPEP